MVHFPGFARTRLCIQRAVTEVHSVGFPHSEISGSKPVCGSPKLIAAVHVLHRLLAPRHPPYALSSLITNSFEALPQMRLPTSFKSRRLNLFAQILAFRLSMSFVHPLGADGSTQGRVVMTDASVITTRSGVEPVSVPLNAARLVGLGRIELPTSPLSGVRSSHLSYRPVQELVELIGIEPTAS